MERNRQSAIAVITCLVVVHLCTPAPAKTLFVDDDANGLGNGSSWDDAYRYLQDALADASSLKTTVEIRVARGTYRPDQSLAHPEGTRDRLASFVLADDVAVKGGFAGVNAADPDARDTVVYETILSGDLAGDDIPVLDPCDLLTERTRGENSLAIVRAWSCSRSAALDGCTITGGSAIGIDGRTAGGSGLYLHGSTDAPSSPSIRNCTFIANHGAGGGAVHASQGGPEFVNCLFIGNVSVGVGAAIYAHPADCTSGACQFVVKGCAFVDNHAADKGGALHVADGTGSLIENCMFARNSSARGGAVFVDSGGGRVADCLFLYNVASDAGGAFYFATRLTMVSCSFWRNMAPRGRAIACLSPLYKGVGPVAKITNMILRDGGDEIHVVDAAQMDATYSSIQGGWPGEGNIDVDPLFADPVDWQADMPYDPNDPWSVGDYHLKSQAGRWDPNSQSWVVDDVTSPCIDAGDPNSPVGDEPQPNGGRINMGAYGGTAEASKSRFDGS